MQKNEFYWRGPKNHRSAIDSDICNSLGIDDFTLLRLRKSFAVAYQGLPYKDKINTRSRGTTYRIDFLTGIMRESLHQEDWNKFLNYIDYTDNEVHEMCDGKICVPPFIIKIYSKVLGITPEFILIGTPPIVNHGDSSIGLWIDPKT